MTRVEQLGAAIFVAHMIASASVAQDRDSRIVRDAVAAYLNDALATAPQFRDRSPVLDPARIDIGYFGKLEADTRPPVVRELRELQALAERLGGRIATGDDLPTCPARYRNCRPLDKMAVQIGEPSFDSSGAFVVYRVSRAMAGSAPYVRSDRYLVRLIAHDGQWIVTTQWPANTTKLGEPTAVRRGRRAVFT